MTVTPKAVEKLVSLRANESDVLSISIRAFGCSGLGYHMEWQDYKIPYDKQIIFGNFATPLLVVTDNKSVLFLAAVTLDYEDGLNGRGFVWTNEGAKRTCGCGPSFSNE
jgi:iron-sulfur cluster assembly protein